jgi:hypothetical protein
MDTPHENLVLIENRQVMLALPWYKTTNPRTAFALMSMMDRKRMAVSLDFGDAFVAHARNKLADHFLRSKHEWCLFVDDDNIPPFGNAALYNSFTGFNLPDKFAGMNGIDRLLSHGKTLIGGVYRGRWAHGKPVFAEGPALEKWVESGPRDEIRPTKWVGFGWVLVHRTVFTDIEKKFPALARGDDGRGGNFFSSSEHDLIRAVENILTDFENPVLPENFGEACDKLKTGLHLARRNSNLGVGEDVQFCRRAAQAGHQCYIDLGCVVGHLGEHCYGYSSKKRLL